MWGTRCAKLEAVLLPLACIAATGAATAQQAAPTQGATVLVFDASRGMGSKLGDAAKIATVRSELAHGIAAYQHRLSFGLVAFGHRKASNCADTEILAKPGQLTVETQEKLIGGIKPKGEAPIGAALTEAARLGGGQGGRLDVILIAGSADSCKVDVCGTAELLKQKMRGLRIHVIAFDENAQKTLASISCIAKKTGGQFLTAANGAELKQRLALTLATISALPLPSGIAVAPQGAPVVAPSSGATMPGALLIPPSPQAAATQSEAVKSTTPGQTDIRTSAPRAVEGQPETSVARVAPAPPARPVPVTFKALITESGPELTSGLVWSVFTTGTSASLSGTLVSTHREAMPTAALLPGEYLVNAAYGLSNLTKKIKVENGKSLEETFVLNTGGLKLAATLADGKPLPAGSVRFDILFDEEDQFGHRQEVLGNAKLGIVIRLNAGAYHIVSTYGDANAVVRADVTVEPGKLTEATIKHAAAPVTFRLVQNPGGEAIADTQWSVLTSRGDLVKESAGAIPTHVLAAGDYAVVARNGGSSYTSRFPVSTGEAKQVEVVMEYGPTSPEALQAIMDPPTESEVGDALASPTGSETGAAFASDPSATPNPGAAGILLNPGILLRPQLP